MSSDISLLLIVGVPVAILLIWRINAVYVFLSLALGALLLNFIGDEAVDFADMFIPFLSANNLSIAIMLLPVLLTAVFMSKTLHGLNTVLNIVPAVGTGLVFALLLVPLLPQTFASEVQATEVWHQMEQLKTLLIGATTLYSIYILWSHRRLHKHHGHDKHGHHGKHAKHH